VVIPMGLFSAPPAPPPPPPPPPGANPPTFASAGMMQMQAQRPGTAKGGTNLTTGPNQIRQQVATANPALAGAGGAGIGLT